MTTITRTPTFAVHGYPDQDGQPTPPPAEREGDMYAQEQLIKGMVDACFWQLWRLDQMRK